MVDGKQFTDSAACKTAYASYNCIMLASTMKAAPCDASGAPMLPCHELCTAYVQACKLGGGISTLAPSPKIFYSDLLSEAPQALYHYAQKALQNEERPGLFCYDSIMKSTTDKEK
jgi:hypothetical protein